MRIYPEVPLLLPKVKRRCAYGGRLLGFWYSIVLVTQQAEWTASGSFGEGQAWRTGDTSSLDPSRNISFTFPSFLYETCES